MSSVKRGKNGRFVNSMELVKLTCNNCRRPFERLRKDLHKTAVNFFCGKACQGKWQGPARRCLHPAVLDGYCTTCLRPLELHWETWFDPHYAEDFE